MGEAAETGRQVCEAILHTCAHYSTMNTGHREGAGESQTVSGHEQCQGLDDAPSSWTLPHGAPKPSHLECGLSVVDRWLLGAEGVNRARKDSTYQTPPWSPSRFSLDK